MMRKPTKSQMGVLLLFLAILLSGCGRFLGQPPTAGNATIDFMAAMTSGDFDDAYGRLCASERDAIARREFVGTEGGRFALLGDMRSVLGAGTSYAEDVDTLDGDVRTAWNEVDGRIGGEAQTWRLSLVREGDWKVCDAVRVR
jgi:hypothetical protein